MFGVEGWKPIIILIMLSPIVGLVLYCIIQWGLWMDEIRQHINYLRGKKRHD